MKKLTKKEIVSRMAARCIKSGRESEAYSEVCRRLRFDVGNMRFFIKKMVKEEHLVASFSGKNVVFGF